MPPFSTPRFAGAPPLPAFARLFQAQALLTAVICLLAGWRLAFPDPTLTAAEAETAGQAILAPGSGLWPHLLEEPRLVLGLALLVLTALGNVVAAALLAARAARAPLFCRVLCLAQCWGLLLVLVFYPYYAVAPPPGVLSGIFFYAAGAGFAALCGVWARYFAVAAVPSSSFSRPLPGRAAEKSVTPGRALTAALCLVVLASGAAALACRAMLALSWRRAGYLIEYASFVELLYCLLPGMACAVWVLALLRRADKTPPLLLQAVLACWTALCLLLAALPWVAVTRYLVLFPPAEQALCLALLWWRLGVEDGDACPVAREGTESLTEQARTGAPFPIHARLLRTANHVRGSILSGKTPGLYLAFLALFTWLCALLENQLLTNLTVFPATAAQFTPSFPSGPLPGVPWPRLAAVVALCVLPPLLLFVCAALALKGDRRTPAASLLLVAVFALTPVLGMLALWPEQVPPEPLWLLFSLLFPPGGGLVLYIAFVLYLGRSKAMRAAYGPDSSEEKREGNSGVSRASVPALVFAAFCCSSLLQYGPYVPNEIQVWLIQQEGGWGSPVISPGTIALSAAAWIVCPLLCVLALLVARKKRAGPGAVKAAVLFWLACLAAKALLPFLSLSSRDMASLFGGAYHLLLPFLPPLLAALGHMEAFGPFSAGARGLRADRQ